MMESEKTGNTHLWYHERDIYGGAYTRCSDCKQTMDGFVRYKYCPYCGTRKTAIETNINHIRDEPKKVCKDN